MNAWKVRWLLLAGAGLLLAACTAAVAPAGDLSPLELPAVETATIEATAEAPTEAPTETPTETPVATPVETPTETPVETPVETPADAAQPPVPTVSSATEGVTGGVSVAGIPGDLLNRIFADASERTGVLPDALVVIRAEAVTWNDGSLGCPEPGMFYTMALVDGYQIVVDAAGKTLDYRVQSNGLFRLCERTLRGGGNRP